MAKTIWKFPLKTTDEYSLAIPADAEILTVQTQNNIPCLWALVEPGNKPATRVIEIFGTGHPVPSGNRLYIATYQLHEGALVFHVFERLSS